MLSNTLRRALSFITSVVLIFASISISVGLMTQDVYAVSAFSQIQAENRNEGTSSISTFTDGNATIAGNIVNGNYMAYYNVDFGSGTNYFKARVAATSYTTIQIRTGSVSGNLLGTLNVNSTGNSNNYQEISCGVGNTTGTNNIYLVFGGPVNIDWFSFNPVSTSTATPTPTSTQTSSTTSSSEVKIEAENYNGGTSSITTKSYGSYGNAAGNINNGDNLSYYNVNLGNGITSFKAKVAAPSATTIEVHTGSVSGNLLCTLNVNSTGGLDNFQEMSCSASGGAGINNIYLLFKGPVNIDWFSFTLSSTSTAIATAAPTQIIKTTTTYTPVYVSSSEIKFQAENYNEGTSSISTFNAGDATVAGNIVNGNNLGYYNINFGNGIRSFKARVATNLNTTIQIRTGSPSGNLLGTLNVNSTGSYSTYQEISFGIGSATGTNNVYLVFGSPLNIDWFSFTLIPTATSTTAPIAASTAVSSRSAFNQIEAESYNSLNGSTTQILSLSSGGYCLGYNSSYKDGSYATFNNVNFGNGANLFKARVATTSSTSIEIRAGSPSGTLLGNLSVPSTGSFYSFQEMTCSISSITGYNNIYIVFNEAVCIDWFTFVASATPTPTATIPPTSVPIRSAFSQIQAESCTSYSVSSIMTFGISNGGTAVGYINSGNYIVFNNLDFGSGASSFKARVASSNAISIEIRKGSSTGTLIGTLPVTATGSTDTYQEMTCSVSNVTGVNDIYFVFSGNANFDWFMFTESSAKPTAIINAFATIQAESYNSASSTNVQTISVATGGNAVGYIESNDYVVFNNVNFGTGAKSFKAKVASASGSTSDIQVRLGSSTGTLLGTLSAPSLSSWDTYSELACNIINTSGINDLYLVFTGPINVDWFIFTSSSVTPTTTINAFATIQAESYNSVSSTNVQTISVADTGGNAIGYIENNNYVIFNNVNFGTGAKSFKAKVASASGSTTDIQIRLGSPTGTLLGTLSAPSLSSWDTYQEITCSIISTSGISDLYLVFTGSINVDWFIFSTTAFTPSPTPSTTITPTPTPKPSTTTTPTPTPSTTPITSATPSARPTPTIAASPTVSSTPIKFDQPNMFISRTAPPSAEIASTQIISSIQKGELSLDGIGTIKSGVKRDIVLLVDNAVSTETVSTDIVSPLDFGIFANRNIRAVGNQASIKGNVHANGTLESYIANCKVTGTSSASKFKIGYGSIYDGEMKTITSPLPMPAFHTKLIDEANTTIIEDTTVTPSQEIHWVFDPDTSDYSKPFPGQTGFNLRYEKNSNTFVITGDGTFNLTSSMYFKGNVRISVPHIVNTGSSFLVADGFINLEGNSINSAELSENDINNNTNLLNVYSIHGRILVATINCKIYGTLYAAGIPDPLYPDDVGVVLLQGINTDIYGSIVAGSDIRIEGSYSNYYGTPVISRIAETEYLRSDCEITSKEAAKQVVEAFRGTDTRMCALQYSDMVDPSNDFRFYSLSNDDEIASLKGNVIDAFPQNTNGFSNMGDALRRAYYLLNESSSDTTKYIVVLASNVPNKWTSDDSSYTIMKTTAGDASFIAGDGTIDTDGNALNYAIEIAKKIKASRINTIYINNSKKDISANLEKIASTSEALKDSTTDKNYFTTTSLYNFSPIYQTVFMDAPDYAVLRMDEYVEILPTGVAAIADPSSYDIDQVQVDGVTRQRLRIKSLELKLRYDGTKYLIENYSINVKIRLLKPGNITLKGIDSKFTYSIDYIDVNGDAKTANFAKNPNDITLKVNMSIDIG